MRRHTLLIALLILGLTSQTGAVQDKPPQDKQPAAVEHIKKLFKDLRNFRDAKVRAEAARQMRDIASALHDSLTPLAFQAISDPDPAVRVQAARAVTAIGAGGRHVAEQLSRGLADPNEEVRIAIVGAIAATSPFSRNAIPKLMQLMKDKNPVMRRGAVGTLGAFGPEARVAIPALVAALDDPDKGEPGKELGVAPYARINLRWIDPDAERAASAIHTIRHADEAKVRAEGFDPIGKDPPKPSQLLPVFVLVLKEKGHPELRGPTAAALGLLGVAAADAVPDLIAALKADDIKDAAADLKARRAVVWALGRIGPHAKAALPELRELHRNAAPELRQEIDAAMKQIQREK